MDGSHCCMDCGAALQPDDGHNLCPTCLGRDHLVEVLSENPCMNSSFMPQVVRVALLAQLCPQDDADWHSKCRGETMVSVLPSRRNRAKSYQGSATRVEQLSTELVEMKSLLQTCQSDVSLPAAGLFSQQMPDLSVEEDVLSPAASDKFRLDLSDEEAVHYMQSLIDESVGALFAAVVEQIHKFAQGQRWEEPKNLRPEQLPKAEKKGKNIVSFVETTLGEGAENPTRAFAGLSGVGLSRLGFRRNTVRNNKRNSKDRPIPTQCIGNIPADTKTQTRNKSVGLRTHKTPAGG
ncbi:hypothetical protein GOODEAATRI_002975 [Goodea atripinnis]|uniref:Uncharacterized protein n=1 Tax=Goodea atripinnis TaxID=208336 RepID=A0ABV0MEW6_9TELE